MKRPVTTLFMLMSVDAKINSGSSDILDVDKDWKTIANLKEGLHQYYEIEQTTDLFSFNSGRTQAKIGVNDRDLDIVNKLDVSFVVVDNKPHLNLNGTEYFARLSKTFYLVTANPDHPAYSLMKKYNNIKILSVSKPTNFNDVFENLYKLGVDRLTIQTGGELNSILLREGLIDFVHLIVAPVLVGGKETPTIIDGISFQKVEDLKKIKTLELLNVKKLNDSYIELFYKVNN